MTFLLMFLLSKIVLLELLLTVKDISQQGGHAKYQFIEGLFVFMFGFLARIILGRFLFLFYIVIEDSIDMCERSE